VIADIFIFVTDNEDRRYSYKVNKQTNKQTDQQQQTCGKRPSFDSNLFFFFFRVLQMWVVAGAQDMFLMETSIHKRYGPFFHIINFV